MDYSDLSRLLKLNKTDVIIYIDLLKFGSSAASTVSVRTSIDRTTVYAALKRMIRKGIISSTAKRGTAYFSAVEPDGLELGIERDIQQKQADLSSLRKILPELNLLMGQQAVRPAVQIFEGAEGIISLYELMLKSGKSIDAFLTIEKLPKELKGYLQKTFIEHKKMRKVKSRVLVSESKYAKKYKELDKKAGRETKIVPKKYLPFETEIIIGKDSLAVIDLRGIFFGVFIKSRSIRNTVAAIFEILWMAM